ncbi:MAG: histidinol dehydrogenase [Actinomycetota bacterium]
MTAIQRVEAAHADGLPALVRALRPAAPAPDLGAEVARLVADVAARGDDALVTQVRAFDCPDFDAGMLRTPAEDLRRAEAALDPALREAILVAAEQVRTVAGALVPGDTTITLPAGQSVRVRSVPVGAVGCYVPGGRAAYPSSLIMCAVPAAAAGVDRIVVASPPGPDGRVSEVVRATASLLGIADVYAAGGAGAIAALAHGTRTIPRVDVIAGPGNAWVAEAKRQVSGIAGIDSVAGPSEVVIVADATADPRAIALDLLAQCEHGPDSPAVLAADDPEVLDAVAAELDGLPDVPGTVTLVRCATRDVAIALAEEFAPEHLQLNIAGAADVADRVRRAGAVFVGPNGATAFGDYVAGSNHVLPTGGAARFASALGPAVYRRRMSVVDMTQDAVDRLTPHLAALADAEGFPLHRRSAETRTTASKEGR